MQIRIASCALSALLMLMITAPIAQADESRPGAPATLRSNTLRVPKGRDRSNDLHASHHTPLSLDGLSFARKADDDIPLPDCEPGCNPCVRKPRRARWDLQVGMWLSGLNGTATVGGNEADIDVDPIDVLSVVKYLDFIIEGRASVTYGDWLLWFGGLTLDASNSVDATVKPPPLPGGPGPGAEIGADVTIGLTTVELGVGYRLGKCVHGTDCCGREKSTSWYAYAGARYFEIRAEIQPLRLPSIKQSEDFVDPIIGGLVQWELGSRWRVRAEANIGGFGVGSDFSYLVRASVSYEFTQSLYASLGFMALDIDAAKDGLAWDVTLYGPFVSLGFTF